MGKTRAGELTAISEANEALKSGVAPNYKANKKLVGLNQEAAQTSPVRAASFLQLRGSSRVSAGQVQQVQKLLEARAASLGSPVLSAIAMKVAASEDHFAKVRQIIEDLIARLEKEATAEATQKTFCDKEMKAAAEATQKTFCDKEMKAA